MRGKLTLNFESVVSKNVFTTIFISFALILGGSFTLRAQQEHKNPDRGFQPGAAYSISDIENINTTNGNLMLNIPLVRLPKGRGEVGQSISLMYNSKLYDTSVEELLDNSSEMKDQNMLVQSNDGGWKYATNEYNLLVKSRFDTTPQIPCDGTGGVVGKNSYSIKVQMSMPDGSLKEFRPTGYSDIYGDGYFSVSPAGYNIHPCTNPGYSLASNSGMVYYSTDGSYTKLIVDFVSGGDTRGQFNPWTMYLPDGSKVTGGVGVATNICDQNNNCTSENFGRNISIQYNAGTDEDHVIMHGVNNEELKWKVKWKNISVNKSYQTTGASSGRGRGGISTQNMITEFRVVDRITLPSQFGSLYYEFNYNSEPGAANGWGELSHIKLPSGAEADYEYTTPIPVNTGNVLLNYVSEKNLTYLAEYDGSSTSVSETWQYGIGKTQSTITAPNGNVTTEYHGNTSYQNLMSGLVYKTVNSDGSISERIWDFNRPTGANTSANVNAYVKTEFTTISDASGNPALTVIKDYTIDPNGNQTEVKEFDWVSYSSVPKDSQGNATGIPGGAVLKRTTTTSYYNSVSANPANAYWSGSSPNVRNAVARTEIAGVSATEITYDNPATTANPILVRNWDSTKAAVSTPLTSANSISVTTQYDQYGNPALTTDANGVQTQITYGAVGGYTGLYPTEVKSAYNTSVQQTVQNEYDFYTGLPKKVTALGNTTSENVVSETEYDALGRPIKAKAAVGTPLEIWSTTEYNNALRRVIVRSDIETKGDGKKIAVQHYDQLGRVRLSRSIENPDTEDPTDEADGIKVQTRYLSVSNVGEYELASNPYRAATSTQAVNEPTMGWKIEFESKNGDLSTIETFSGVGMPAPWGNNTNSTGIGKEEEDTTATITTDERGKKRRTLNDALGRMVRVDEPNENNDLGSVSSPTQPTYYSYDAIGNLTQITQGEQNRTFTYNSLSRLLSATNPESGTFQYTYDDNGNLLTKTDARNVSTAYTYDALNRATLRNYSDDTPDISYVYDDGVVPFSKGKLTKISSSVAETRYTAFNAEDRILSSQQIIDGQTYDFSYTYYLSGALKTQTYPSGKVVKFDYRSDGDLAQVSNQQTQKVYANSFGYSAHGRVEKMRLGNGRWETTEFNGTLQITQIGLGHSATDTGLWKTNYEYGDWESGALNQQKNNGNLARQTISVPTIGAATGFIAVQTYNYDSLDRLKSAEETVVGASKWKQTFLYDRYTNRNFDTANTTLQSVESNVPKVVNPEVLPSNNRYKQDQDNDGQADYLYDASGNLTKDAQNRYFTYDGENRQLTATGSNLSMSYAYDGNGKRVKTFNAMTNQTTIFVYDTDGDLAAEYTLNTPPPSNPTISYLTDDALGSVRITTNSFGEVKARRDFLPFGEEIYANIGNRNVNQKYSSNTDDTRKKFATYQRDQETGLDFAQSRYYSPMQGRFTSPDEFKGGPDELFDFEEHASANPTFYADLENPQSLNKYQYAYNNPYKYNDTTGHCPPCPAQITAPFPWVWSIPKIYIGRPPIPIIETLDGRRIPASETVMDELGDIYDRKGNLLVRGPRSLKLGAQVQVKPRIKPVQATHKKLNGSKKKTNDKHSNAEARRKKEQKRAANNKKKKTKPKPKTDPNLPTTNKYKPEEPVELPRQPRNPNEYNTPEKPKVNPTPLIKPIEGNK